MANKWALTDYYNSYEYELDFDDIFCAKNSIKIETQIEDKTFQDGGFQTGESRQKSRQIEFDFTYTNNNESLFRNKINELIYECKKATYLKDLEQEIQTKIIFQGVEIKYETGGFNMHAKFTLRFEIVDSYWEDCIDTYEQKFIDGATGTLTINLDTYVETPFLFNAAKVTTSGTFSFGNSNGDGLIIQVDPLLVDPLYFAIDTNLGMVYIDDAESNNAITQNTGFFYLQPGGNQISCAATYIETISITYRKRYYL